MKCEECRINIQEGLDGSKERVDKLEDYIKGFSRGYLEKMESIEKRMEYLVNMTDANRSSINILGKAVTALENPPPQHVDEIDESYSGWLKPIMKLKADEIENEIRTIFDFLREDERGLTKNDAIKIVKRVLEGKDGT